MTLWRAIGGVAVVGQEIEGDLWAQSLGLDLPPPSVRIHFKTRSPTRGQPLCKIWGAAETHV